MLMSKREKARNVAETVASRIPRNDIKPVIALALVCATILLAVLAFTGEPEFEGEVVYPSNESPEPVNDSGSNSETSGGDNGTAENQTLSDSNGNKSNTTG